MPRLDIFDDERRRHSIACRLKFVRRRLPLPLLPPRHLASLPTPRNGTTLPCRDVGRRGGFTTPARKSPHAAPEGNRRRAPLAPSAHHHARHRLPHHGHSQLDFSMITIIRRCALDFDLDCLMSHAAATAAHNSADSPRPAADHDALECPGH